jgi:hypothetical protein
VGKVAADLDEDLQGSLYELREFAGGGDLEADPDFAQLPQGVQLALQTLAAYSDGESFDGTEPGEPVPSGAPYTGAESGHTADAAARLTAQGQAAAAQLVKKESSMIQSKEAIWTEIQKEAIATSIAKAEDGQALTSEQAVTAFLGSPAGSKLYDAWRSAPWDADLKGAREATTGPTSVSKSELEVSGETLLHNLAVKLQKDEGGTYVDAYAKVLDSAAGSLVYTTAFGRKRSGGKG